MERNVILCLLYYFLSMTVSNCQGLIAVQNGDSVEFFTNIVNAFDSADNGDTVYLPAGNFGLAYSYALSNAYQFNKKIHIIGVGHNPDSTQATGITYVHGSFVFLGMDAVGNTSSGSSVSGLYLNGDILFGNGSSSNSQLDVDNIVVSRCNIRGIRGHYDGSGSGICCGCVNNGNADNNLFYENIIRGNLTGISGNSNVFTNNIIVGSLFSTGNSFIGNNIFLGQTQCFPFCSYPLSGVQNAVIENNIFLSTNESLGDYYFCGGNRVSSQNNILNRNYFVGVFGYCQGCLTTSSFEKVSQSEIFVFQEGNIFNYDHNYHLLSPQLYLGADGTEAGLYGGLFPWKDGSLPANPHLQFKNISSRTDQNGNLKINIIVKSQEN